MICVLPLRCRSLVFDLCIIGTVKEAVLIRLCHRAVQFACLGLLSNCGAPQLVQYPPGMAGAPLLPAYAIRGTSVLLESEVLLLVSSQAGVLPVLHDVRIQQPVSAQSVQCSRQHLPGMLL